MAAAFPSFIGAGLGFFTFGFPNNSFVSVDVTDDCNLRCKHCYFFEQEQYAENGEYSIDEWVAHFEKLKREQPWAPEAGLAQLLERGAVPPQIGRAHV